MDNFSFTCNGWRNLFAISELVYQELCVEFFASISFEAAIVDPFYPRELILCLGCEYMECSLSKFAWRMGIYEQQETQLPAFELFMRTAAREYLSGASGPDFWSTIANGVFDSGVSQESQIRSLIHSLLHRLIGFSMNHKRHGDKVTSLNLFFLWSIVTPGVFYNILYHLANYLGSKATISRAGSPVNGGNFVTRLASSYGILVPRLTRTLTHKLGDDLTMGYLESMRVVTNEGSYWSILRDDDVEYQDQPRPRRRNVRGRGEREQL